MVYPPGIQPKTQEIKKKKKKLLTKYPYEPFVEIGRKWGFVLILFKYLA